MSRIFLLSCNVTTEPYPVYPLGMAVVASALQGAGHQVRQFDYLASGRSEEKLREALRVFAPDFVCLSLRNIDNVDSFASERAWYLGLARAQVALIREVTEAPLIVGGPAFSIMPGEILSYIGADFGVAGEGEKAVCDLIEALGRGEEPPRITTGSSALLRGEQMVSPLYDQELIDFYVGESGMVNLQTKRGCPHNCSYCTYPALEGNLFRAREPIAVVDDIERIQRDHGAASFFFTDSVFNDAAGHYLLVAEELIRRGTRIRWCGFFRPQGLGRSEISLLKASGLYAVELGTDASSDTTLRGLNKGFTFADVLAVNEACVAEELPCSHFIMFGGPGETLETVDEGLANIARLEHAVVFAFSGIRILPGTDLHAQAVREGVLEASAPLLMPSYYFSPGLDPEAMNARILASFQGRRDRIFPPSDGQEKMAVMHRFGYRGILWDKLISYRSAGKKA